MADPVALGEYPGIRIEYHEAPYRHYLVNGEKAVSVTTALGILDKPLTGWAANITAAGAWKLARYAGYRMPDDMRVPQGARAFLLPPNVTDSTTQGRWIYKWSEMEALIKDDPTSLVRIYKETGPTLFGWRLMAGQLRQLGLDHRSTTGKAADRGVDVHAVLEDWIERQKIPNTGDYPKDRHGYIRALSKFLMKHSPEFYESEQVVGSAVHGFAGRLDSVAVLRIGGKGRVMLDAKTSKGVYPNSHFPQLAGYEIGRRECGLEPTDNQGILRLGADGEFEIAWSDAKADDFLVVLRAWRSQSKWRK